MALKNPTMASYRFLAEMYDDAYFPDRVVARGEAILRELCGSLEAWPPTSDADVLKRTHAATERFNDLEQDFADAGSENRDRRPGVHRHGLRGDRRGLWLRPPGPRRGDRPARLVKPAFPGPTSDPLRLRGAASDPPTRSAP